MLKEDFKVEKKEAKEFPPLPKDVYQVELFDINTETRPTYDTRNKNDDEKVYEDVLNFQFTLLEGKDEEGELRGRNVWANFVQSYFYIGKKNGKNKTMKIVEALLGRELSQQEEAEGVNGAFLNSLIGNQCRVSVEPKQKDDKTYDNITDFLCAKEQIEPLTAEEKENAKVKKEDEKSDQTQTQKEPTPEDPAFWQPTE